MTRRTVVIALVLVWTAVVVGAQAPTTVAERITTHLDRINRVSLFSNRTVVVSVRSDADDYVHRVTLESEVYMAYLQQLTEAAGRISDRPVGSGVRSRDSVTTVILNVGPDAPRIIRYSPLSSLDLSLNLVTAIMDDLRALALETIPGAYELSQWKPEIGQRVTLRSGGTAVVIAVEDDESVVLKREDIIITIVVAKENRADIILSLEGEPQ